jgi:hypothetical protein
VDGRFGPDSLQDEETTKALLHAGVDHVGTTLREMATELRRLATIAAPPESGDVATVQARA